MKPQQALERFKQAASLSHVDATYLNELQSQFHQDPDSLPEGWANFFLGVEFVEKGALGATAPNTEHAQPSRSQAAAAQARRLITLHRLLGHRAALTDPLGLQEVPALPELDPEQYGLGGADLDTPMLVKAMDPEHAYPLSEVLGILKRVYCGSIGAEYLHITTTEQREWVKRRLESTHGEWQRKHTSQERARVLQELIAAEDMERYLHRQYVGQKRFSLEGGESLIPLLKSVIENGRKRGVEDIVMGMAHRGRLNVLINILGKSPQKLFAEFAGEFDPVMADKSGDVKYHQGYYSEVETDHGPVNLALAFNPSHLEIVTPVVEGGVRARQDRKDKDPKNKVMPITIHGDAAFIGQGVTAETLNLSKTPNYGTGGTIHIVINNQIGFTTSRPHEARSTQYCTEVAKMVQAPIFHVNADDPDAVLYVAKLALDYRMTFNNDVVIDLVCYRRHGHNEADEPMMTQPAMYKKIKQQQTTRALFARKLVTQGVLTDQDVAAYAADYKARLESTSTVPGFQGGSHNGYAPDIEKYLKSDSPREVVDTSVPLETLQKLGGNLTHTPANLVLQRGVAKVIEARKQAIAGEIPMDWGTAEAMALATLLNDDFAVRLSGQDSERGTFAHRHAVLYDQQTNESYTPLAHLKPQQPRFNVINSLLSELAVLGFEYGYATSSPKTLVMWEAQFGDFANCAQVVIDQFVSSGFQKWGRVCQLTMLLPHGYEGQGPEHSSARLERFLQLCAELNMRVWTPTTPAQYFHLLRDQMMRTFRRPLIVMTPKSLLRHPLVKSELKDLTDGGLQVYLPEQDEMDAKKVRRVVLCSGKVYYDLLQTRRDRELDDIAIVRVEQLYPFPRIRLAEELKQYTNLEELVWCQEEPRNQGAWYQIQHHLQALQGTEHVKLGYAGREASASPACGSLKLHQAQQQELVDLALSVGPILDHGERLQDYC